MRFNAQVETRLYQLIAQVKQIANEQAYQRVSLKYKYKYRPLFGSDARSLRRLVRLSSVN